MNERDRLVKQLIIDEDLRLFPYVDTVGKITIGIGRNLTDRGITEAEALFLLDTDISLCELELTTRLPWFASLDPVRQRVLLNMAFNLGVPRLLAFKQTIASLQQGHYATAAQQMLHSKWARQVGQRAQRLSRMMEFGVDS